MSLIRIAALSVGTVLMFGGVFAYNAYVHRPMIAGMCKSHCAKQDMAYTLKSTGYGRSYSTGCTCLAPGGESKAGYFLVSGEFLDWFLLIWVRLIPLAIIAGFGLFIMAKIVPRLPGPPLK